MTTYYNACPDCGGQKDTRAKRCLAARDHHREHMTPERAKAMSIKGLAARWGAY